MLVWGRVNLKIWGCNRRGFGKGIQDIQVDSFEAFPVIHFIPFLWPCHTLWSHDTSVQVTTSVARARPEPPVIPKSKSWKTNWNEDFWYPAEPSESPPTVQGDFLWNQTKKFPFHFGWLKISCFEGFPPSILKKGRMVPWYQKHGEGFSWWLIYSDNMPIAEWIQLEITWYKLTQQLL